MASRTRPRANSEILPGNQSENGQPRNISSSIDLVSEAFYRYQLPTNLGQDSAGLADGIHHRIQSRFLGLSSLKLGSCCFPNTAFYEITESEISEIVFSDKKQRSYSEPESGFDGPDDDVDKAIGTPPECVDALLSLAGSSPIDPVMLEDVGTTQLQHRRSLSVLPPKKRGRHRMIRKNVVFCLCLDEHDPREAFLVPCLDRDYFLFPRDAVVDAVNQASPFEVMFSYHPPKQSESSALLHSMCSCRSSESNPMPIYQSKLEEFAAVCSDHLASRTLCGSSAQRRFTDPGLQFQWKADCHVLNMQLSGVSKDLYIAMKQIVSGFEAVCQRMVELMRLHTERVTCEKSEIKEEYITNATAKMEAQSEEEDLYDKTHTFYESTSGITGHWSSDDNNWEKELDDEQDETDYCMASPHSKTAPEPPFPSSKSTTLKGSPITTTTTTGATSTSKTRAAGSNGNCTKKCLYCGSKSTPMWRRGPQGAGTLCNACGVKWKHGKILCGNDAPQFLPPPTRTVSGKEQQQQHQEQLQPQNQQRRNSTKAATDKRRKKTSAAAIRKDRRHKLRQQRKRVNLETTKEFSDEEDVMTGIEYTTSFTTTAPRDIASTADYRYQQGSWEQATPLPSHPSSSLSSYSQSLDDSCSPLESFSSSPNSSIHDPLLEKLASSSFPLSDAVEAATVLTLLKRS